MKFTFKLKKFISDTVKNFSGVFFISLLIFLFSAKVVFSQALDFTAKKPVINITGKSSYRDILLYDSLGGKTKGKINFTMKKSPWKAVAYSAILPGAGQFYNESYWKIPVIAGLGGYFVYEWIKNNNTYLDYRQDYINSQTPENPSGNLQLQSLREFYRDQRDNFIVYSLILYVVNLIDSYVDAQLYDFNVSDKIKLGVLQNQKIVNLSFGF